MEQIRLQIGSDSVDGFSYLKNLMNQMMVCATFGERMRGEYRRELYKREYHPPVCFFPWRWRVVQWIKADGKTDCLASLQRPITYQQILNVEGPYAVTTTLGVWNCQARADIFKVMLDKLGDIDPEDVTAYDTILWRESQASGVNWHDWGVLLWWFWRNSHARQVVSLSTKILSHRLAEIMTPH